LSDMLTKVKFPLLGLLLSFSIFLMGVIIWNIVNFPLSRQKVEAEMTAYCILAVQEKSGLLVYITETDHTYSIHIFVPSMLFNRYRLLTQNEYANHFVTAAPAKFTYYVLEVNSTLVKFISSNTMRIQSNHVIGFLIFLVASTNMSCRVLCRRFGKSEKERL